MSAVIVKNLFIITICPFFPLLNDGDPDSKYYLFKTVASKHRSRREEGRLAWQSGFLYILIDFPHFGTEMLIEQIPIGGDRNFGYLIADKERSVAAIVDPSGAPQLFARRIQDLKLSLKWVILTHDHWDHTGGADELKILFNADTAAHLSSSYTADTGLQDNQTLELGGLLLRIIHTPGHTDDSICVYTEGSVFTGDTLFVGKIGGTHDEQSARKEYESLHNKLLKLPDDTKVYPGHDVGVRPVSTIGDEKRENPFLLQPDFARFLDLKNNWLEYKRKHGIA